MEEILARYAKLGDLALVKLPDEDPLGPGVIFHGPRLVPRDPDAGPAYGFELRWNAPSGEPYVIQFDARRVLWVAPVNPADPAP